MNTHPDKSRDNAPRDTADPAGNLHPETGPAADPEAVRALRAAVAAEQWWYVNLYPGGIAQMDDCVRRVVAPLVDDVTRSGASRWFFIRYGDPDGPHIRFRARAPGAVVDAWHQNLGDLERALAELPVAQPARWIAPVPPHLISGRHRGVRPRIYEPEWAKYGGPKGVELAEILFEVSSRLAVQAIALDKVPDRCALAIAVLDATTALLPDASRADFWAFHRRYWTGGGPDQMAPPERIERWLAVYARWIGEGTDWSVQIGGWTSAVTDQLEHTDRTQVPVPDGDLVFHQLHMTMNRFGVLPAEEALLGQVVAELQRRRAADGWWPGRDALHAVAGCCHIDAPAPADVDESKTTAGTEEME